MMLVINSKMIILIITITKKIDKKKKAQKISTQTQMLTTSREFSNFNVYLQFIHKNLLLLGLL